MSRFAIACSRPVGPDPRLFRAARSDQPPHERVAEPGEGVALRLLAESSFLTFGIRDTAEDFEALAWPWRIGLPVAGGLGLGILMTSVSPATRQVGVVHVMERLAFHAGRLPWRNAVLQFIGATIAIVSGHSVGRERRLVTTTKHLGVDRHGSRSHQPDDRDDDQ